jgi:hypothetical protein
MKIQEGVLIMKNNGEELLLNDNTENKEAKVQKEIFEIDVRLQEIDAILERYEDILYEKEEEILSPEEVENLVIEYRELKRKKKELSKSLKNSKWDVMPLWMAFYAVFQFVFSFYLLQSVICLRFAVWLSELIFKVWVPDLWFFYVLIFLLPFLSLLASLIILLKIKNKEKKKMFAIIYIIHGIETIITVVYLLVKVLA